MKLLAPLILVLLGAFQRCNDDALHLPDGQLILKVDETYKAGEMELQLSGINDSRCPEGVNCVWAGAAVTTLALKAPSFQDTLKLCLGDCRQLGLPFRERHSDTLSVNGRRYELSLLEVLPYPGAGKEGEDKTARYSLRKLPE
ncbi:hypothetical protein EDD80_11161 [Anseongella ginsenosidimutans]|uniref:Uncharacterized protein n=1 Tax=Anseongella ginsenosidimutans TaxID=496056 RepID=A0A4R3KNN4_9SPHI|nr:hypothetical protein [Anseongella ginsenosidimutans]QEC52034.1 hypothetical protein FRZ59_06625 [Anseongella ginsenosidimutans]TCS85659.1 hypothetical protein EDD80_11161 [Anseongella ginsenosidimutans]